MNIDKPKLQPLLWAVTGAWKAGDQDLHLRTDALDAFLGETTVEEVALALLAEIEQLRESHEQVCANYNLVSFASEERGKQVEQLKAENDALRSLVLSALEEGKGRPGTGGNAPGHCHGVPGVWDRGNGDRSGTACGWCKIWNAAQAMAREASHG